MLMKSSCGAQPHLPSFSHCDAHRTRRRCASNVICSSSHLRSSETQLPEDLYTVDVLYSSNSCAKRKLLLSPLTLLAWGLLPMEDADAISLKGAACPGQNGYALQQCLRNARKEQEARDQGGGEEAGKSEGAVGEGVPFSTSGRSGQPGELITLPSGKTCREILKGSGPRTVQLGDELEIQYIVYQTLKATPILLWSLGTGFENKDDVDDVYRFRYGDPGSLPEAAQPMLEGMRVGGRRRVLVPPQEGWVDDLVEPRPPSFGGKRRLISHRQEPLLLEVILVRIV